MTDLTALLASAQDAFSSIKSGTTEIQTVRSTQQKLAETAADQVAQAGVNDALVAKQKDLGTIQTQNAMAKAGAIFGADLSQSGELISDYAARQQTAREQRMALEHTITEKQSVGFTDNPLAYIINQFTVNDDINKHNALLDEEDGLGKSIEDITRESSAVAQNQKNFEISVTQASAQAKADSITQLAAANAAKIKIDGMNYQAEAINAALQGKKSIYDIQSSLTSFKEREQEMDLRMKEYAMHSAQFKWAKQDRADKQASDESLAATIQKGLNVMYGTGPNVPNLSLSPQAAKDWIMRLKSGGEVGKLANAAYMAGLSGVIGGSPAQVIDGLYNGQQYEVKPGQEPVIKLFSSVIQDLKGSAPKDDAERQQLVNSQVNSRLEQMAKKIKPGDVDNVFNVGDVRQYLSAPALSSVPLVQKVLANSQVDMSEPSNLRLEAIRGVKEGTISVEEAAEGLKALYKTAVGVNLGTKNLSRFGVTLDSKKESTGSYKAELRADPKAVLFKGTDTVNLTDSTDIKRSLLKGISELYMFRNNLGAVPAAKLGN